MIEATTIKKIGMRGGEENEAAGQVKKVASRSKLTIKAVLTI